MIDSNMDPDTALAHIRELEAAGKLTGDSKAEAGGKADKAAGKAQNTLNRLL